MNETNKNLTIALTSFGFKHGPAPDAHIMMDMRFLQNAYWVEDLKPMSGLDAPVGDYIRQDPEFEPFMENFQKLLEPLLPRYESKGREELKIAIGCTGGQHRSVFTVETLSKILKSQGLNTQTHHRDLKV